LKSISSGIKGFAGSEGNASRKIASTAGRIVLSFNVTVQALVNP